MHFSKPVDFVSFLPQTSTVPSYHAECSPAAKRGAFIMIEGSLIAFGIMISYVSLVTSIF